MAVSSFAGFGLAAAAFVGAVSLASPQAHAITYGERDCSDLTTSFRCHPNTVSLSGFRNPAPGEDAEYVSFLRCSGSLLSKDDHHFVILTAGHCASAYLVGLRDETLVDVGVSFDAKIERDIDPSKTIWSANQYILGGKPVLTADYGPQGTNASNIQFDYAVIVFDAVAGMATTAGGQVVDLANIEPIELPPVVDYLLDKVSAPNPLLITAVGYGTGEAHAKPGAGGNAGGAVNSTEEFGERWMTDLTAAFSFKGPEKNLLTGSQNPARGYEGTCGGDSGGPLFYVDNGVEIQVGITSSGDAKCRASSIIARTDSTRAVDFLACVKAGAELADIEACGCTSVDRQGECPE